MARRRYKSDAISTAGHAEAASNPTPDESFQRPIEPRQEYGKSEPEAASEPAQHFSSGLGQRLHDMRQQAQADALDHYIAQAFPGAMAQERQWLRMNAHHLQNPMLVHHAAQIALQRGIPRQAPEFLHFVGQLLDQHAAAQAQPAPASHVPAPPPPPMPAQTHIDLESHSEPGEEAMPSRYSAPVSRGDHGSGRTYEAEPSSRVVLSPEERELCAINKIDETKYAEGKLKLAKMKKAKLVSD